MFIAALLFKFVTVLYPTTERLKRSNCTVTSLLDLGRYASIITVKHT